MQLSVKWHNVFELSLLLIRKGTVAFCGFVSAHTADLYYLRSPSGITMSWDDCCFSLIVVMLKFFTARPLLGPCSRVAAGVCSQQWHGGLRGWFARKMGREHCSEWGRVCAMAVDMCREGRLFSCKVWGRGLGCSLQPAGNAQLPAQGGSRSGWWLRAQPWLPSMLATSAGQQISGRRRRTKPLIIHSLPSTHSLSAHLDRPENNSVQEQGQ